MRSSFGVSTAVALTMCICASAVAATAPATTTETLATSEPSRSVPRLWHELAGPHIDVSDRAASNGSPHARTTGPSSVRNLFAEPPPRTLPELSSLGFAAIAFGALAVITRRRKH